MKVELVFESVKSQNNKYQDHDCQRLHVHLQTTKQVKNGDVIAFKMLYRIIDSNQKELCSFHVFLDVQYSGSLNLWKTEGANARLSFARAGKALAISGANNSVQVISGQSLLQWTDDSSVELQGWFSDFGRKSFYHIQNNKCS